MAQAVIISYTQEILTVATDAQLQGRTTGVDANNLVTALDTMVRLAFALSNLTSSEHGEFNSALRVQLESWLANLRFQLEPGQLQIAPLRAMVSSLPVSPTALQASNDPAQAHVATLMRMLAGQLGSISLL
jgi:hypothetical protein